MGAEYSLPSNCCCKCHDAIEENEFNSPTKNNGLYAYPPPPPALISPSKNAINNNPNELFNLGIDKPIASVFFFQFYYQLKGKRKNYTKFIKKI